MPSNIFLTKECIDCRKPIYVRLDHAKDHKGRCKVCSIANARQRQNITTGFCRKCGIPLTDDNKKKGSNICKYCQSVEEQERRLTLKREVMNHYGGSCACCGETHLFFLAIDHINGGGNKQRKELNITAGVAFYKYLKDNDYPEGYRVLCHNCNQAIGSYGYCPHNMPMLHSKEDSDLIIDLLRSPNA